jgi:hypothetical protein
MEVTLAPVPEGSSFNIIIRTHQELTGPPSAAARTAHDYWRRVDPGLDAETGMRSSTLKRAKGATGSKAPGHVATAASAPMRVVPIKSIRAGILGLDMTLHSTMLV